MLMAVWRVNIYPVRDTQLNILCGFLAFVSFLSVTCIGMIVYYMDRKKYIYSTSEIAAGTRPIAVHAAMTLDSKSC